MVKILRYIDRKFDKRSGFSRAESGEEDTKEKGIKKSSKRVFAEDELDMLMNDGWQVVSASTSQFITGVMGNMTSFDQLTVIVRKDGSAE
jgi:hypothetical protein